jgi:SAM-dependent methyltransferase
MTPEEEREFYEKEYGVIYSSEKGTTPAALFQARLKDAKTYYEQAKKFLGTKDSCLELGSASGYFLATIKEHVNSVRGVESHKLLRQYAQEIGIETAETVGELKNATFDRIFMFFLLEHVGDPIEYLKGIKKLMKKDGKLFIEVPNVEDALFSVYDIPPFRQFYFTPAHQYYYSKKTLSTIIEKSGFTEYEIKYLQRYDLSNHMHWMMKGKPGGSGAYNSIFSEELLSDYSRCLVEKGVSDTLFAIVTKTD